MDYHKIPYKVRKFAQRYEAHASNEDLFSIKREFDPERDETFYNTIKHLYLSMSVTCGLPEWYLALVQYRHHELEAYFLKRCEKIIAEAWLSEYTDDFIDKKLLKHYRDKGSFYLTPVMDNLPLHLRLKLYVHLYRDEKDPHLCCYLRHRMAALLAKFNEQQTAQQLSVYNWVIAKDAKDSYFADVKHLTQTLKAHKINAHEVSHWQVNHEASLLAQELCMYYKSILVDLNGYTTANMATLELVALSYTHYPALGALTFAIKSYLRTKDKAAFMALLEEQKRLFIYTYEEKIWRDQELKDQLIIFRELLKLQ